MSAKRGLPPAPVGTGIVATACARSTAQPTFTSRATSFARALIVVCAGPAVDGTGPPAGVRVCGAAWNESDAARRLPPLDESWADQGSCVDVTMDAPIGWGATGSTVLVGEDSGELDDDGRFGRVVGWHE